MRKECFVKNLRVQSHTIVAWMKSVTHEQGITATLCHFAFPRVANTHDRQASDE